MLRDDRRRLRKQGRATHSGFLGIPKYVFRAQEFGELSAWALKLLIELAGQYNGSNNGNLSCSYTQLHRRGWNSSATLDKARKALISAGWIVTARAGSRARCSLYAVTWWPIDECPGKFLEVSRESVASNRWQKTKNVVAMRTDVVAMRTGAA